MKCPECQFDNIEGVNFCNECGHKLEVSCLECGKLNPQGSKFCNECGQNLKILKETSSIDYTKPKSYTPRFLADKILTSRSSIEGEKKLVTVLFADVANYTSIAENLDAEEVHQIMDSFFKILMDEIHKYEGTINQFTGDGIMSLFGAPLAQEDHAQRACYAALAIQRAMIGFSDMLEKAKGFDFKLRIGLNTGTVVVGSIGDDLRMDYTALGDTTNLAARMQQNAKPGTIIMSDSSYKLISQHFVTKPLGKIQLKGKAEPVASYLLKSARGIRTLMDIAAEKGLSPLAGRKEELNRLHQFWNLANKGRGQVVFIVSEAGIGKSRLIFEFHRSLSEEKVTWLEAYSMTYGKNMPFLTLMDLLKRNFRIDDGDPEKTVIQKIEEGLSLLGKEPKERAPYLKFLFSVDPGDPLIQSMDAQGRRRMIFDSIRLMTTKGSNIRPLILTFEDLQWIDTDSEEFLKYLIDSLAVLPVMLILSYRPGYVNPFGERTFFNRISLKPLKDDESLELTKRLTGISNLPDLLESLIIERAEGNPFYIEEMTRSLDEMGAFKRFAAVKAATDIDKIQIPLSIQDIIMTRIDRLLEEQKNALQFMAVIGRKFAYGLLEKIVKLKDEATDILGDLVSLELIYQTQFHPEPEYMFKNALTQDVVYNGLLTSKRKAIHADVGKKIETFYSERLAEYYEIVAHHYEHGEVWDKAIQYLILSGEKALRNMANPSANKFFKKAIDIFNQKDAKLLPDQEYRIYQGKANTEFNLGKIKEAGKDFFKAREIARNTGNQDKEGESLSMAGWSLAVGKKYEKAIEIYKEAIKFGRQIKNPIIEGRNLVGLGVLLLYLGEVQKSNHYITKAYEVGKKIESPLLLTFSLSIKAFQFPHYGIPDEEAIKYLNRSIPFLKSAQNVRACAHVYFITGYNLVCKGDYTAGLAAFQEGINFTEETGEPLSRAKGLNWLGWVYSELGCISDSKKYNKESYESALNIISGSEEAEANAVINLAENAVADGDYEQAKIYIDELSKKAKKDPGYLSMKHRWEVRQLCTLGKIFLYEKNTAEALKNVKRAYEIAEITLNKRGMIKANRLMGKIFISKSEFSKAEKKLNEAIADARKVGNPYQLWRTLFTFGRLYEAQGLNQDAREQYREAIQVVENISTTLKDEKIKNTFLNSDSIMRIRDKLENLEL